jgi:hypothetical protein
MQRGSLLWIVCTTIHNAQGQCAPEDQNAGCDYDRWGPVIRDAGIKAD